MSVASAVGLFCTKNVHAVNSRARFINSYRGKVRWSWRDNDEEWQYRLVPIQHYTSLEWSNALISWFFIRNNFVTKTVFKVEGSKSKKTHFLHPVHGSLKVSSIHPRGPLRLRRPQANMACSEKKIVCVFLLSHILGLSSWFRHS